MSAFGSGFSNGQFWYGKSTGFPGFLYKKNVEPVFRFNIFYLS